MLIATNFQCAVGQNRKTLSCEVQRNGQRRRLFFACESNQEFSQRNSSSTGFLLGLLWPAMLLGEDIYIEGAVNEEMIYLSNNDIQELLVSHEPRLKRIKVTASDLLSNQYNSTGLVATGFSAGIDSFATLCMFSEDKVPPSLFVDSVTTFNVGALGHGESAELLFDKYQKRNRRFAESTSRKWFNVNSNLDDFYTSAISRFQKTHVIRNVAAAYALHECISNYLYSSSFTYSDLNKGDFDMAFIEPMLLSLVSSGTLRFMSAGSGLSRIQKTLLVADYEPSFNMLDVCIDDPVSRALRDRPNCSKCKKCSRTLLTLDALGKLSNFESVFNIDEYRRNKNIAYETTALEARKGSLSARDLIGFLNGGPSPHRSY